MTQRVDKDSLPLDKPRRTPNHPTKSHIVKTKVDGKEKIIRFGEQGASTAGKPKAGESDRMKAKRASFKARHSKNIAKGKSSAAYWADRVKWAEGGAVRNRRTRGTPALDLIEQMRRSGQRNEAEFDVARLARTRRQDRLPVPPIPPRPPVAPGVLESVPTPVQAPQNFPGETANDATPTRNVTYDGNNPLVIAAANAAQRYNIPIPLFLAQIQQESRFDPNARSRVGAFGLGQLMPATARELGVDPRDPIQNLDGSARYMRQMLDRFGEVPLALAAYNAGPGRVRRAGNTIPNIPETQNYVSTIMRNAGLPGYAEGGLAELDQKYAEGGAVMAGPMAYDPNQIEALAREVEGGAEPQGYAEGGEVSSPEDKEYDRRLIERWRQDQGYRVDNPTWPEQRAAIARAGREAAETAAELLLPQSPLDFALMAALGPGGRAVRIPAAAALAAMEPSEAEAGRARRGLQAAGRAIRGAPENIYPLASEAPRFKIEPEPGQAFDDWIDSIYSPAVRGPDNVTRFPSLMYRGVSDAELNAAIDAGAVRPLSGPAVYVENSPDRYVGGGAYGARRAGAILQFDVGGLPSTTIQSPNVRDLVESGVPEIPLERVRRIWRWDPDRESHVLMSEGEMAKFLRRAQPEGNAEGGLAELDRRYARGGKVEAGLEGMYRRYYEGGSVGGDPADNDTSASTAEGQAAAGGVSGEGAGPTGAGAGSPADAGPGPDSGPSGVGGGGMSMADPEGTAAAANMNTAVQAAAMGYGYDPATGFAGTGMAPTGFHADPGALGAISGMLSGTISPTQALGYAMQSAIPGATIGTQIDEFGNARPAANVDFGQMIGTLGGTMAGLATGFGPGAGRVGGMVGSALGQALGYEPGVVGYSPGVYGGPATPNMSGDDYLNYGYNYGYAPVNQDVPVPVNATMPVNVFGRRVNV